MNKRFILLAGAILLVLILAGVAIAVQPRNKKAATPPEDLVTQVGRLIILPAGETPTIATVTDLEKLKDLPFFADAQIGDKVLIYTIAKKAILYRPSENKVVEIAPLTEKASSTTTPPTPTPAVTSANVTVQVLNGTGKSGMAGKLATQLKQSGFTQAIAGNADTTVASTVIEYKSAFQDSADKINGIINNQATLKLNDNLNSDIVVTLGKSYK